MILDTREAAYKAGLSEAMYLFLLAKMTNPNTQELDYIAKENGYIDENGLIAPGMLDILTDATAASMPGAAPFLFAQAQARALMGIWPGGIKPGTTSSWRGTLKQNTLRLLQFTSVFDKYDISVLVKAAKAYLESFEDTTYIKTLPNFIIQEEVLSESYDKILSVPTSLLEQYIVLTSEDNDEQ